MALLSKDDKDSNTIVSVVSPVLTGTFSVGQLVMISAIACLPTRNHQEFSMPIMARRQPPARRYFFALNVGWEPRRVRPGPGSILIAGETPFGRDDQGFRGRKRLALRSALRQADDACLTSPRHPEARMPTTNLNALRIKLRLGPANFLRDRSCGGYHPDPRDP